MNSTHTLFADFASHDDADRAVTVLKDKGYDAKDISVITKDGDKTATTDAAGDAASGALSGATTGGVIGGITGLLAGVGVVPALAGILIGGPIAAALGLAGVAAVTVSGVVTGAVAGGLIGALTKLGLSEEDAAYYNSAVEKGGIVLAIPVSESNESEIRQVLKQCNAGAIDTTGTHHQVAASSAPAVDAVSAAPEVR